MEADENMIVESSKCGSSELNNRGRVCEVCGTGAVLQSQTKLVAPGGAPMGCGWGLTLEPLQCCVKGWSHWLLFQSMHGHWVAIHIHFGPPI